MADKWLSTRELPTFNAAKLKRGKRKRRCEANIVQQAAPVIIPSVNLSALHQTRLNSFFKPDPDKKSRPMRSFAPKKSTIVYRLDSINKCSARRSVNAGNGMEGVKCLKADAEELALYGPCGDSLWDDSSTELSPCLVDQGVVSDNAATTKCSGNIIGGTATAKSPCSRCIRPGDVADNNDSPSSFYLSTLNDLQACTGTTDVVTEDLSPCIVGPSFRLPPSYDDEDRGKSAHVAARFDDATKASVDEGCFDSSRGLCSKSNAANDSVRKPVVKNSPFEIPHWDSLHTVGSDFSLCRLSPMKFSEWPGHSFSYAGGNPAFADSDASLKPPSPLRLSQLHASVD